MVSGEVLSKVAKGDYQQSEVRKGATADISEQCVAILQNQEQRRFKVIYASSDRKRAFSFGEVLVGRSEDGISFSLLDESKRDKVCGHLGTLATFVCFFESPDQSRPTIIHAMIHRVKTRNGEFDVQLGRLGTEKADCRGINLTTGWLLFRLAPESGNHEIQS